MAVKKYLSLDRLTEYDALIKQEIVDAVNGKANASHRHDDIYYTESEIDSKLSAVNTSITNITSGTIVVKEAEHATSADSADEATHASSADTAASADSAAKAAQLTTARTISLSGDASGSVSFNGSQDVSITVTVVDDSHNHTISNIDGLQTALNGKASSAHDHNDVYYTETEVDTLLSGKSDTTHKHDSDYDKKGAADASLASAKSYTDTKTSGLASTTVVDNKISAHNTSSTAHNDIRNLISALTTKVNNFLDVDDATTDQLSEVLTLIQNNKGTLESLTSNKVNVSDIVDNLTTSSSSKVLSAKQGVELKSLIDALQSEFDAHGHEIADVSGLQSALDGKASSSHGTHVTYSTTAPVMDGTASAGSATTVARSDHKHPTDTSRASQADLDALEGVVAGKADTGHTHSISNITNLQTALDGKAPSSHNHTVANITDLTATATELNYMDGVTSNVQTQLDGKSDSGHGHNNASTSAAGFMTADMVSKLNGIATGANKTTVDSSLSSTSTNPVQNKVVNSAISTLTSTVSTNTSSISSHTTAISNLQTALGEIQEITSEEISALFV